MAGVIETSIKRGGVWGGLGDASRSQPTLGMFSRLVGCYLSRDGTELKRWPGSAIGAKPFLGQSYEISGGVQGETTVVELGVSHYHREIGATADWVYVAGNGDIEDGVHLADRNTNTALELAVDTGASAALATDGHVWVDREEVIHGLYCVEGRPVIVGETRVFKTDGTVEQNNIAAWVGSRFVDVSDPELPGFPADPDVGFQLYRSPTMLPFSGTEDDSDIWHMTFAGRIQGDVLNGRLCLAVPGHGHLWQVDVGRSRYPLRYPTEEVPDHRVIKALGIPRGVINTFTSLPDIHPSGFPKDEVVWAAIGYMDPVTGEVGRPSRAIRWTAGSDIPSHAGPFALRIQVHSPRSVLLETHGLAIVVYAAYGDDTSEPELLPRQVTYLGVGNRPNARPPETDFPRVFPLDLVSLPEEDDAQPDIAPGYYPIQEQMPVGATVCRVARSRLASAGDHGSGADAEHVNLTVRTASGTGNFAEAESYICPSDSDVAGATLLESRAAHYRLPSAYEGHQLSLIDGALDDALTVGRLTETLNPRISQHRQGFLYDVPEVPNEPLIEKDGFLHLMPHLMGFTEEAATGVSPAVNRVPIDRLQGLRPWGIGRLGDAWIVCTDRETFYMAWGSYPRLASAVRLSNEYGCIAPCSMVEYPGGLVWLSAEGPVGTQGGGVQMIGREIRELWATWQRDSAGRMWHAQGLYDCERELVVWTLRGPDDESEAWANAASDAAKAVVPGDLLLWWHPATGAFGTHLASWGREVSGLCPMPQADATWAACWLAGPWDTDGFHPIYVTGDAYADRGAAVVTYTATVDRVAGVATFEGGDNAALVIGKGDEAFIRAPDGTLRWWGTIASTNEDAYALNDADGAVWKSGDVLVARVIHMGFTTLRGRFGKMRQRSTVSGVTLRFDLGSATYAYARVRVTNESGTTADMCESVWGDRLSGTTQQLRRKAVTGSEFTIAVDVIADAQVTLKDCALEVEGSE